MTSLRPRFENFLNYQVLLPELKPDRVEIAPDTARARGIELSVLRRTSSPLSWWFTYTWSKVEDEFGGMDVRRSWDQSNAFSAAVNWESERWEASLIGTYHTGWPTTAVALAEDTPMGSEVPIIVTGPRNANRLGPYRSLDARLARHFELENSSVTVFLELTNAFSRSNECCVEYEVEDEDGELVLDTETLDFLPTIPSLGFVWRF